MCACRYPLRSTPACVGHRPSGPTRRTVLGLGLGLGASAKWTYQADSVRVRVRVRGLGQVDLPGGQC
eukprot:scaffold32245_cov48-Phaeocystis_antarctica.AAC.2